MISRAFQCLRLGTIRQSLVSHHGTYQQMQRVCLSSKTAVKTPDQSVKSNQAPEQSANVAPKQATKNEVVDSTRAQFEEELGPCVLGLFAGQVDKNLTIYPELDTMEEVEAVHKTVEPVEKFFSENVNSSELDAQAEFLPPPLLAGLRQLGLFGAAFNLSAVVQARLAECLSTDASIELTLRAHNSLGVRALLDGAKPELLNRLTGQLASGDRIAAFCLTEPGGGGAFSNPLGGIRCRAVRDSDSDWLLNGTKIWVANAPVADAFVVVANSSIQDGTNGQPAESQQRLTAFLVERDQPGVSVGPREVGLGVRSAAVGALHLDNVRVTPDNVLGDIDDGHLLVRRVVAAGRMSAAASTVGSLKRLVGEAAQRCKLRRPGGLPPLGEYPMVQQRLARMAGAAYATESVAYLLAFLSDQYPDADLSAEAAALHLLSTRSALTVVLDAAELAGGGALASNEFPHERRLRDALTLAGADAPLDLVRLQLASRGVKHAASVAADSAHRLMSTKGLLQKFRLMKEMRVAGESHNLAVHWHPNLAGVSNSLEVHIEGFMRAVRQCLFYYNTDLSDEQLLLERMANCSVDIFTILACCSRASRSKSIGLRSADNELDLVVMLSKEAALRLEHNIAGLNPDNLYTRHADAEFKRVSDFAVKFGGYAIDHPVSRNWN